jgi:hypothetical protein
VGWWEQIRGALNGMWADLRRPSLEARTQLGTALTEAWRAEQRVATHIRQTIPDILYEQMRCHLDAMANDDAHHAHLLQECLKDFDVSLLDSSQQLGGGDHDFPRGPWRRLRHILAEKRELYECYRQEAGNVDEPALQSLLQRLRDDEERHQERLIDMLTHLDAHVHDTIT